MLPINTSLIDHFPPKDKTEQQKLNTYLQEAPFVKGHWKLIKQLYKKLEGQSEPMPRALAIIIARIDQAPLVEDRKNLYPTAATLAYMKRRAARYLRKLSKENEAIYVEICLALFQLQKQAVDHAHQWVLLNIIQGNSKRVKQRRNGRGIYAANKEIPNIYRKEDKASDIWDRHVDDLLKLWHGKVLAPEIYEFIAKVLMRNRKAVPTVAPHLLLPFFNSNSPWLQSFAAKASWNLLQKGEEKNMETWAKTYYYAPANTKKVIQKAISTPQKQGEAPNSFLGRITSFFTGEEQPSKNQVNLRNFDMSMFVTYLSTLIFPQLDNKKPKNRVGVGLNLVLGKASMIPSMLIKQNLVGILAQNDWRLTNLVKSNIEKSKQKDVKSWLGALDHASAEQKKVFYPALASKYPIQKLRLRDVERFVINDSPSIVDFGWYLLSLQNDPKNTIRNLANRLYWRSMAYKPYKNTIQSEYGAKVLIKYHSNFITWAINYGRPFDLMKHGHPLFYEPAKKALINVAQRNFYRWLPRLKNLEDRDAIIEEIKQRNNKQTNFVAYQVAQCLVDEDEWVHKNTLEFLLNGRLKENSFRQIVRAVVNQFYAKKINRFHQVVMEHFDKHYQNIYFDTLQRLVNSRPDYIYKLAPVFDKLFHNLNVDTVVKMVSTTHNRQWGMLEKPFVDYLKGANGANCWVKILNQLMVEEKDTLYKRTLNYPAANETLNNTSDIAILDITHSPLEKRLFEWVEANEALFAPESEALLQGCAHALNSIRKWSIERAKQQDFDLPFALRLMETDVPDAFKLGHSFFKRPLEYEGQMMERVLAMCDSPRRAVREAGLQLTKEQEANLNPEQLISYLSEQTDPFIQKYVAELLVRYPDAQKRMKRFDEAVLRTKNKGRKTKELVKERLENTLAVDPKALLRMAKGKNKKDAEWAILQLTKMAIAGEEQLGDFVLK